MTRRRRLALVVGLALPLLLAVPAAAQDVGGVRINDVDDGAFPDVTLRVSAPIEFADRDLPADAFRVFADGNRRQHRITQLPGEAATQDIAVVVDTSGSMTSGDAMDAAIDAATQFVDAMPPGTRLTVVAFADEAVLAQPLTDDHDAVRDALAGLAAEGNTALYDGVQAALDELGDEAGAERSVIVLSDGGDNESAADLDGTVERLDGSGVTLYAVELDTGETERDVLAALADAGGGELLTTADPSALVDLYGDLAARVANEYALTYTAREGGDTRLEVQFVFAGTLSEDVRAVTLPPYTGQGGGGDVTEAGPPPPRSGAVQPAPALAGGQALLLGGIALFAALALIALLIAVPGAPRSQLRGRFRIGNPRAGAGALASRATLVVSQQLKRRDLERGVDAALERAGINLRAGEFIAAVAGLGVIAAGLTFLVAPPLVALAVAAAVALLPRLVVGYLGSRRQAAFAEQLSDVLQLLAGTLRAGYGTLQAIDTVAQEAPDPTAEEFRRVVVEVRLGRDLTTALEAAARRVGNPDFEWVVQAIAIHREVGGDLAEVLDRVAETIRQRHQIARQVKTLSAEGRMSAVILFVLPIALAAYMITVNPEYIGELTTHTAGWVMMGLGVVLMIVGGFWLRRIVRVEY